MAIGIFDSGLGGLTVLDAVLTALPDQEIVYLGDNLNAPYGVRSARDIMDLTMAGVQRLFDAGCPLVVLACNTASAVALRAMQEYWVPADRRVLGVFVPLIEAVTGLPWAHVGPPVDGRKRRLHLYATPATVRSGAFSRELRLRARGVEVAEIACDGLVDCLEAGDGAGAAGVLRACVAQGLGTLPAPDAVALGCTHYPLLRAQFAAALPAGTPIYDQPGVAADALVDYLRRHPRFASSGGCTYLTTGRPREVEAAARRFLGRRVAFNSA